MGCGRVAVAEAGWAAKHVGGRRLPPCARTLAAAAAVKMRLDHLRVLWHWFGMWNAAASAAGGTWLWSGMCRACPWVAERSGAHAACDRPTTGWAVRSCQQASTLLLRVCLPAAAALLCAVRQQLLVQLGHSHAVGVLCTASLPSSE
jgi:hypothetical protein